MGLLVRLASPTLLAILAVSWFATPTQAQVAFQAFPSAIPSGATLDVTPAVSADRRYVRLSVNPFFNDVAGFSNFPVAGAVAGGGGRFFSVEDPGVTMTAGMNGIQAGYGGPTPYTSPAYPASADPFAAAMLNGAGGVRPSRLATAPPPRPSTRNAPRRSTRGRKAAASKRAPAGKR